MRFCSYSFRRGTTQVAAPRSSLRWTDPLWSRACLASLSVLAVVPLGCFASGFRIPGTSVAGVATTDALVADPYEAGAMVYNPAAMSFHDKTSLTLGLVLVEPDTSVTPSGGGGKIDDDPDSPFPVPNLYLMVPIAPDWRVGLNVSAPFGLETNWRSGTFPAFAGPLAPLEPAKTRLEMFNVNPNVAYRLGDNLSVAAGVDYYYVRDAVSDTQAISISGDGSDSGWNVAALYVVGDWSLGASYRSGAKVDLNGSFDATSVLGFEVDTETQLDLPDMLQIGLRYQATRQLAVELDLERTNWSEFENIVVRSDGFVAAAGIVPGTELVRTENNWHDTNSYHFGIMYELNAAVQLRFGYTYDEDPQPEAHFSARYPNSERHLLGAGAKYSASSWDLEASLLYAYWEDRTVRNSLPYTGGDPNGTDGFNGKYELSGIIGGVGITRYF